MHRVFYHLSCKLPREIGYPKATQKNKAMLSQKWYVHAIVYARKIQEKNLLFQDTMEVNMRFIMYTYKTNMINSIQVKGSLQIVVHELERFQIFGAWKPGLSRIYRTCFSLTRKLLCFAQPSSCVSHQEYHTPVTWYACSQRK